MVKVTSKDSMGWSELGHNPVWKQTIIWTPMLGVCKMKTKDKIIPKLGLSKKIMGMENATVLCV